MNVETQRIKEDCVQNLISVIIPTYNRANFIVEALNSVMRQSYRPIEIQVVDDGSTDATSEVVRDWERKYSENNDLVLRYHYQENAGAPSARNLALLESRGEFIQFLDSDDRLHPERFQRLVTLCRETECDFIQTGFDGFCSECGEVIERKYGKTHEEQLILALKGRLWPNSLRSFFRRRLLVKTGFWIEEMTCFQDYEYILRALLHSKKSIAMRDILASARRNGSSRLSDTRTEYTGRSYRIRSEQTLCDGIRHRDDIPFEAKQAFASRLYGLGFRTNARGWSDLGKRCGDLADNLKVKLDLKGRKRWLAYRLGKFGGITYAYMARIKNWKKHHHKNTKAHVCRKSLP